MPRAPLGFPLWLLRFLKRQWLGRMLAIHEVSRRYPDAELGSGVEIWAPARLRLGTGVIVRGQTLLDCGGAKWCNHQGGIRLGDHVEITSSILLGAGEIEIGRCVEVGPWSMIASSGVDYSMEFATLPRPRHFFRKVVIADFVKLGTRVTILPGVTVGEGAVLTTGTVVTRDVPPYRIVAGVPARVVGDRKDYRPPSLPDDLKSS